PLNRHKIRKSLIQPSEILIAEGSQPEELWHDADELPWLPVPKMRVLDRWIDAPRGFLASIEYLLASADGARAELLHAVQEEVDITHPGHRIYRRREERMDALPPQPRRYRAHMSPTATRTNKQG
ncbi:MAG: hypothetical protein ACRDH9_08480, partial [Actinomycetota bacterium]